MLAFQKNPVEFLNDLIASQCHENDVRHIFQFYHCALLTILRNQ